MVMLSIVLFDNPIPDSNGAIGAAGMGERSSRHGQASRR